MNNIIEKNYGTFVNRTNLRGYEKSYIMEQIGLAAENWGFAAFDVRVMHYIKWRDEICGKYLCRAKRRDGTRFNFVVWESPIDPMDEREDCVEVCI